MASYLSSIDTSTYNPTRQFVLDLNEGDSMALTLDGSMCGSQQGITFIDLKQTMSPVDAFFAAQTNAGPLKFDNTIYPSETFNAEDATITAPPGGGILLLFMTCAVPSTGHIARITDLASGEVLLVHEYTSSGAPMMTLSSTGMWQLSEGQQLQMSNENGDNANPEASLIGVWYNPVGASYAWCVSPSNNFHGDETQAAPPRVEMDFAFVNEGNLWDTTNYELTIPVTGLYLINIMVSICLGNINNISYIYHVSINI